MNMLPNDHHPGPRCSCAECLLKYQLAVMAAEQIESLQRDQLVYDDLTRTISNQLNAIERLQAKVADLELIKAGSDKRSLMLINENEQLRADHEAIRAVIAEMITVAADGDRDEADWTADNCAQIDAWQVRLADAVAKGWATEFRADELSRRET